MTVLQSAARIERREFKYLLPSALADEVRSRLPAFCALDPHSAKMPDRHYGIESLYLDTWNLALYGANEQERLDRFKLRVRRYPDHLGDSVFFEVKRRYHDVILKTRGRVPHERWQRLITDAWVPTIELGGDPNVERFVAMVHHWSARPMTLVRYEREAWASVIDEYARVTFDTLIRAQPAQGASFGQDPRGWRALDNPALQKTQGSLVVLELKFVSQAPSWMAHIVQRLDLWRRSFSKYGSSLLACLRDPAITARTAIH